MTTLLRQTTTGLYNRGQDEWTDDPCRALDFRFSDRALRYARTWSLQDVELAFVFDDRNEVAAMSLEQALRYWRNEEETGSD